MDFKIKMPENGRRKIFRDKQRTSKVTLMLLDVKVVTIAFLDSFKKQRVYVFSV